MKLPARIIQASLLCLSLSACNNEASPPITESQQPTDTSSMVAPADTAPAALPDTTATPRHESGAKLDSKAAAHAGQMANHSKPAPIKMQARPGLHGDSPVPTTATRDTVAVMQDTIMPTATPKPPVAMAARRAELGYNYQPRMPRMSTQIITAMVKIKEGAGDHPVRAALNDEVRAENIATERRNDSTYVFPQEMRVYQFLTVRLSDPSGKCEIAPEDSARQELDTADGNLWHWRLTANTSQPDVMLRMQVYGEKPGGTGKYLYASLPIKVNIQTAAFVRETKTYLLDDPKALWAAVVAVAGFLGWLIKWRLGKKKPDGGDAGREGGS